MQFIGRKTLRTTFATGALATVTGLTLALAACGGGSAPTTAATQRPAAASASAPAAPAAQAVAVPAPSCPGTNAVADGPCNWSQASWSQYLADLGATDPSAVCLATEVAREVDFTSADAVAKAFPPGTSGKSEQEYITQLVNVDHVNLAEAQVDVVAVESAQNSTDCSSATAAVQPAATTPATTLSQAATTPAPPGTADAPYVWTQAQRDKFIAAYMADQPALGNLRAACLTAAVPTVIDGDSAVQYVGVAWTNPTPTKDEIKQRLIAKYGAAQGAADFNNWNTKVAPAIRNCS